MNRVWISNGAVGRSIGKALGDEEQPGRYEYEGEIEGRYEREYEREGKREAEFGVRGEPPREDGGNANRGNARRGVCWGAIGFVLLGVVGCDLPELDDGTRRLRMGHVYEVKSPTHAFGTAHLDEKLREAGVGMEVAVFPAAQLGSESELLEQLVAGEIDLAIAGPSFLAMWHPPLGAFDAAYAFEDLAQMQRVADGPLMAPHWAALRERFGVRVLATWAYGSRHITGNRPVRHPEDLRGFRLRMPAATVWQASGRALGASPMPIAFSEVYMALQQGIADGQENPVPVIHAMGFHEVQRYVSLTGHIQSSIQVLINERVWQSLTAPQREALGDAVAALGEQILAGTRNQEAELLARWRAEGPVEVIDDVDVAAFETRARETFADGFAFSELYRTISRDRRSRHAAEPGDGEPGDGEPGAMLPGEAADR